MKDSPGNAGTFRLMMDVLMKIPPGSSNVIVKGQGFEPHPAGCARPRPRLYGLTPGPRASLHRQGDMPVGVKVAGWDGMVTCK